MRRALRDLREAVSDYAVGAVIAVMLTALARREATAGRIEIQRSR